MTSEPDTHCLQCPPVDGKTSAGDNLLVSVIVAAFNAADYIEETCLSVIRQTYKALELIVVDDGSTDETGDIIRALVQRDPRVRCIRQPNSGVAAARNAGIAAARGNFIAPLDADDLWDPTKIERQVRRLQEAGPDAGFAYCWWVSIDVEGHVLDGSPRWQVEGHVLENLLEINFTGNASVPLFRRSCIEEAGGYDVTLREHGCQGCEDWNLVLRVAERHRVVAVPAVLVGYRRRTNSMSTACETMWQSRSRVVTALVARQPFLSHRALRRSSSQFALHLVSVAFWSGRYLEAFRWALRVQPLLGFCIAPYFLRAAALRFLPRKRLGLPLAAGDSMSEARVPEALVPYDLVYAKRWGQSGD